MTDKMREAARSVLDNTLLTLAARGTTLIGIPVLLAWLYWATGQVSDLSQRMAVVEAQRITGRNEIVQRLERVEASDVRDREALSSMQRELSGVAATTAAILREIETMRREAILREQRGR